MSAYLHALRLIIADIMRIDPDMVLEESESDTLPGWDSLRHLNLMTEIQDRFEVRFSPEEIEQAVSVRAILDLLDRKVTG